MKISYHELDYAYGSKMQKLRNSIGLTQAGLADKLGVSLRTVAGWEAGRSYPRVAHLKELIALAVQQRAFDVGHEAEEIRLLWKVAHQRTWLDERWLSALLSKQREAVDNVALETVEETKSHSPVLAHPASEPVEHAGNETETQTLLHAVDQETPMVQNLPFPPNPFFTGRETELLLMSQLFERNARIAISQPLSVSGLGGIGKTQLALEYAHQCYPNVYHSILWANAADKASLETSYLSLAHLLKLPEEKEKEVERVVQAVKIWLGEHPHWLLILDNADDLELVRSFLPTRPRGHILLTTRSQIVGNMATLIQVETLSPEVGLLFLLRRSGVLPPGTEPESIEASIRQAAGEVVEMLSGHPLALDQAGAYIEETSNHEVCATAASFTEYRQIYQEQRHILLKRRGSLGGDHPESVALTFEISVQKACELHPKCADVLAFCSLLHPDTIPEELLHQGLNLDLPHFNEVIRALRSYSLIKRNAEKQVLSLHRLVQAVIRDGMNKQTLQQWRECVVQVVNNAFPEVAFEEWKRCERYLPHALICVNSLLHEVVPPPQVSHLLAKAGAYLRERGQYADAEPHLVQDLTIREQHLGTEHLNTAESLNNLANLYFQQGKYEQAESLYQRALLIREQHLGKEHPDTAMSLNNLANLYWYQGKYKQAEPLYQRALLIREQYLGKEHPDTAKSLNNLANLYWYQGKYKQAEPLFLRALSIREQHLGKEHPDTAFSLDSLANLYLQQGKYEQAEPLFLRALSIREQHLGTEHTDTAMSLNNLAELYRHQGKYEQAESLYQRALSIYELQLGTEHTDTAMSLNNLAELYRHQGKYEQAESLYQRALSIYELQLGTEHPNIAHPLHGLARLYQQQDKYERAEPLFLRALALREKRLGPNHPLTEMSRKAYTAFLHLARLAK